MPTTLILLKKTTLQHELGLPSFRLIKINYLKHRGHKDSPGYPVLQYVYKVSIGSKCFSKV